MTIPCDEARRAIPWLLDDEVDPAQLLELEEHLNTCDACRDIIEHESALRDTVRRAGAAINAPPALRHSIRDLLDRERRRQNPLVQLWPAVAVAAILLALIWKGGVGNGLPDLDEAAQRHANLPLDVAGDLTAVQRYFNGKLPFAVQIPRMSNMPESLLGGRVTRLRDREAAYVRYEMPRGHMAVFVYQDPSGNVSDLAPLYRVGQTRMVVQSIRGYTVARWRSSGLVYSIVTDLSPQEISAVLDFGPPLRR